MDTVTFYFSFRSPYAWLAYYRLAAVLERLPIRVDRVPVFPPPNFPNDPAAVPAKLQYLKQDVERTAAAYGLSVQWPRTTDTAWMRPHAAYLYGADQQQGDAFALQAYAARFSHGRDLGADDTLRQVAGACQLDAAAVVRAADDPSMHERVRHGLQQAMQHGIFGVPTFIYGGQIYWGNDRIEWLLRAVQLRTGQAVPNLERDLLARPCL